MRERGKGERRLVIRKEDRQDQPSEGIGSEELRQAMGAGAASAL